MVKDKTQQERDYLGEIEQLKQRVNPLQKLNNKLVLENKRLRSLLPEKRILRNGKKMMSVYNSIVERCAQFFFNMFWLMYWCIVVGKSGL